MALTEDIQVVTQGHSGSLPRRLHADAWPGPASSVMIRRVSLLGEALKVRREELGLGQEALADTLGVSQQTVSRWETGLALPRPARVVQLADLLDLDSARLHRLAGYLPQQEQSERSARLQDVYATMGGFSRTELLLVLDRAWQELRSREGLSPPGVP